MIAVKYPVCDKRNVSKNRRTLKGAQKYICNKKECADGSFLQDYSYNGRKHGVDEQIIAINTNASGIRDTSRVLKAKSGRRSLCEQIEAAELDEM